MPKSTNSDYTFAVSPIVPLNYLYLASMDTKFDPKYSITLMINPANKEEKEFMISIFKLNKDAHDALLKDIKANKKSYRLKESIFSEAVDAEGNPTGLFRMKATTKQKPAVVDAEGNQLGDEETKKLYSGTKGRVKLSLRKSVATQQKTLGLAVYFSGVQIIDPVFGGGGDGGFDAVEGGYKAQGATTNDNSQDPETPDF